MRNLKNVLIGVALGFAAAHIINSTSVGRSFFRSLNEATQTFNKSFMRALENSEHREKK